MCSSKLPPAALGKLQSTKRNNENHKGMHKIKESELLKQNSFTIKKRVEVLITVKVHTGVLAVWVIVSRREPSLRRGR